MALNFLYITMEINIIKGLYTLKQEKGHATPTISCRFTDDNDNNSETSFLDNTVCVEVLAKLTCMPFSLLQVYISPLY